MASQKPDPADKPCAGTQAGGAGAVHLRDVRKTYTEGGQRHEVLHGIDLDVAAGEALALLGRSGSGKSTLLNLIAGIETPDSGEVAIDGVALHRLDEQARTLFRRRHIGFVFQSFNLIPTLSVLENVLLPLELNGRLQAAARREARDLLDTVGLAGRAHAYPDRLSGGEQQRVAVVRAIIHRPRLLLADEPTGNLDEASGAVVLQLLRERVPGGETALILVTHSREVAALADRIVTLRDGRLQPDGPSHARTGMEPGA